MKRAIEAGSSVSAARRLLGCVAWWLAAWAGLLTLPAWGAGEPPAPTMVHVTQVEVLREPPGPGTAADDPFNEIISETVDEATLNGRWETRSLPISLKELPGADLVQNAGGRQTAWVRVRLDALADARGAIDFYLMRWLAFGQLAIYSDGQLIYRSSKSPMRNLAARRAVLLPLSRGDDGAPPRTLLIRLTWVADKQVSLSSLYVGPTAQVADLAQRNHLLLRQIPYTVSAVFLLLGFFALGLWCYRRDFPGRLIFAISVLAIVWRWHFQLDVDHATVPDPWFIWLTHNAVLWQFIAQHWLIKSLHGRRQVWLDRALLLVGVVTPLLTLSVAWLPPHAMFNRALTIQTLVIAVSLVVIAAGLWNAWRARAFDSGLLAICMLVGLAAALSEGVFGVFGGIEGEISLISIYVPRIFVAACVYLTMRHYVQLVAEIKEAKSTLEERLQLREAELQQSHARLSEIERRQTLSDERQRLMDDMHDGLGSSLSSVLRMVSQRYDTDAELQAVIRSCIDDLKLTIDSMEPVQDDLLQLLATLRYRFGPRLQHAGITLRWEVTEVPKLEWLDPRRSLHILRILQEALANALQHTRTSEIRVATHADLLSVWVTVADNGTGFDVAATQQRGGGRGLMNQQRRAAELGGRLELASSASGTRLSLVLPLQVDAPGPPKRLTPAENS
ncbi:MAG: sensor histidine kinase [Burkholderiales bacterium]|nr:sensor histidine kinase [Burkholderiales bacterium]